MKEKFEKYLITQGYKEYTPSGNKSTVFDYSMRIDRVCKWENISWGQLADRIGYYISLYDVGGSKEDFGKKSHNAVICALRRFQSFIG